jgi:hypothetical protein
VRYSAFRYPLHGAQLRRMLAPARVELLPSATSAMNASNSMLFQLPWRETHPEPCLRRSDSAALPRESESIPDKGLRLHTRIEPDRLGVLGSDDDDDI